MEKKRSRQTFLILWATVAALLLQNLFTPALSCRSPPRSSRTPPSHGSGGARTPPSHGSGSGKTPNCGNPPSRGGGHTPTPSPPSGGTGGGDSRPSPPTSAGSPPTTPSTPDISVPSPPFDPNSPPSGGGGYCPSPPTYGGTSPTTPIESPDTPSIPVISTPSAPFDPNSPPSGGGGYYYSSNPSIPDIFTPLAPFDPNAPPSGGYYPSPPSFPTPSTPGIPIILPPITPIINPGTPGIYMPPPLFDPNSPPFPIDYWRTNPALIWGLFGWWATVGSAFGVAGAPGLGSNFNLLQALSNHRSDGVGELYREGTASLLNSMVGKKFPYTTKQVRDSFVAALSSNKTAAAQAARFKLANEGRFKP
ncbi:unnamed protein product [Withania somnifera]